MRGFSLFRFFFFPFSVPSLSMPSFVPLCPMSSFSPVLFLSSPCSLCPSPFFLFPFPAHRYPLSFFSLSFLCPRPVLSILFSPRLSPVLPVLFSPRLSPVLPVLFSPHLSPVLPVLFSVLPQSFLCVFLPARRYSLSFLAPSFFSLSSVLPSPSFPLCLSQRRQTETASPYGYAQDPSA